MRATSGTWLHAQLTVLVATCWATGCGGTTNNPDDPNAGAGAATGGSGSIAQAGKAAQAGSVAQAGSAAQGGTTAEGGATAQGGTTAQGGEVASGGATPGGAPGLICPSGSPRLTDGWHTEPALDYVAQIWSSSDVPATQEESGTRCAGASSKPDCESAYAALVPRDYWAKGAPALIKEYFAYTRGDVVDTIGNVDELRGILGDIDTANEAALWLYANSRPVPCDKLEALPDGYLGHSRQLLSDCPITYQPVDVKVSPNGTLTETKVGEVIKTTSCAGRRPDGLQLAPGARARSDNQLGNCFAEMAELELASIAAFAALEQQLAAHGAPEPLLERCRTARADEMGHARLVARLARRFGAQPKSVRVAAQGLPSLRQLALENAREGCVRELYGAAVATWQSAHAQDPQIREVFSGIARDEAEHAALALDLAAWLEPRLSEAERAEVAAERQRALEQLRTELLLAPDAETQRVAGLPSAAQAAALLTALSGDALARA